jgi:hypothetical protein
MNTDELFAQLIQEEFPAWDLDHNPDHEDLYEPAYVPRSDQR